jgi:hypothetical protein
MIYNLEPLDRTISAIVRNLGLGGSTIPYADFVEWIADGLEHIGSYYQLREKSEVLIIDNNQGLLPCDFHKMIQIHEMKSINYSQYSGFYGASAIDILSKNIPDLFVVGEDGKSPYDNMTAYERFRVLAVGGLQTPASGSPATETMKYNGNLIGSPEITNLYGREYHISHNRITTSFKTGVMYVTYLAMPVDERGWPLVPDNVSFRDALFWKVTYHLSMLNPSALPNKQMQDMEYCKQKWDWYCGQARAEANMPDQAMMSRMANNWVSFFGQTAHQRDFMGSGLPSQLTLNGLK